MRYHVVVIDHLEGTVDVPRSIVSIQDACGLALNFPFDEAV